MPEQRLSRKSHLYGCPVYEDVPPPPTGRIIFQSRPPGAATAILGIQPAGAWPPPAWRLEWDGSRLPDVLAAGLGGQLIFDGVPYRIEHQQEIVVNRGGDWMTTLTVCPEWTRETDHLWRGESGYQLAARAGMSQADAEIIRDYGAAGPPHGERIV